MFIATQGKVGREKEHGVGGKLLTQTIQLPRKRVV